MLRGWGRACPGRAEGHGILDGTNAGAPRHRRTTHALAGVTVRGYRRESSQPRVEAELRAKVATGQPPRYYYDRRREVQDLAYAFRLRHGARPPDVTALYLRFLEDEGLMANERAARAGADLFAHFEIEPSSSLILVRIEQDYADAAAALTAAWQKARRQDAGD